MAGEIEFDKFGIDIRVEFIDFFNYRYDLRFRAAPKNNQLGVGVGERDSRCSSDTAITRAGNDD